jgi:hypothetical protein
MPAKRRTATPKPDRKGYTITKQEPPGGQVSYSIVRDADGTGVGAYTEDQIDGAIALDREYLASRETPKS